MNFSSYLPLLVDLMLKSGVLLGVALAAAWAGRRVSAANRHLIWLAAFGQLLVLPFATTWVSGAASRAGEPGPETAIVLRLPFETSPWSEVLRPAPTVAPMSVWRSMIGWATNNWRDGVIAAWLSGVVGLLVWRMMGAGRLRWLWRQSAVVRDPRIEAWALRIAVDSGLRRRVELRCAEACPVAMTWGTFRPVVMLPADAAAWSDERIELVLRHELAHVARRDCLARLISQVACALYWPNPLVWLGARRLRLAQEQACDDRVLTAGAEAGAYASELLAGARALAGRGRNAAALAMAEPSTLENRIVGIVDEARDRGAVRRRAIWLAMGAAGLALIGCTSLQVREARDAWEAPPGPTAARDLRQVEIETKFIQFKADAPEAAAVLAALEKMPGYVSASRELKEGLSPEVAAELIDDLLNRVAAEVISAPKITVLDGNRAVLNIAQELRYPAVGGERVDAAQEAVHTHVAGATIPGVGPGGVPARVREDGKASGGVVNTPGTPADFARREVGVKLDALPRVEADGRVALELVASVTQFEGFVEFAAAPKAVSASDGKRSAGERPSLESLNLEALNFQPIFSTREVRVVERIGSGKGMVFQLGRTKRIETPMADGSRSVTTANPDVADDRIVLVIVTATEIFPGLIPLPGGSAQASANVPGPHTATEATDRSKPVRP